LFLQVEAAPACIMSCPHGHGGDGCVGCVRQMHALVDLVGPVGVEIIDGELLAYIREHMREVKAVLDANAAVRPV
jgi:hypothetical protein